MPLTVLVDREDRSRSAMLVDPLVFEAHINALLAEWVCVQLILPTGAHHTPKVREFWFPVRRQRQEAQEVED